MRSLRVVKSCRRLFSSAAAPMPASSSHQPPRVPHQPRVHNASSPNGSRDSTQTRKNNDQAEVHKLASVASHAAQVKVRDVNFWQTIVDRFFALQTQHSSDNANDSCQESSRHKSGSKSEAAFVMAFARFTEALGQSQHFRASTKPAKNGGDSFECANVLAMLADRFCLHVNQPL